MAAVLQAHCWPMNELTLAIKALDLDKLRGLLDDWRITGQLDAHGM